QFKVVRDPNVRALKLINSELDLIQGSMPPETAAWLAGRAETVVESYAGDTFTYLGINHQHPVLSKHAVRAAIAHGIDRQAIATHLFAGRATTANRVFPEGHWLGSASSNAYEYDPDKARQLLRGFSPDTLKFSYKTSTDPLRLRVAAVIKAQLEAIGIAIDIQSFDWATFYSDVRNGRFDLYSLSWTGLRLPDFYRQAFHSESVPPNGVNRGRYRNAEVDQLLDEATRAVTAREQLTLYTGMGNFLAEDLPYIPLWFEKHVVARRVEIASYRTRLSGGYAALNAVSKKWGRHGN
ncbi:MAG: ABC transporter substrate-binding protein, partial [Pseudomonadota bacterium]